MKRFYCLTCKRIRRVRKLPTYTVVSEKLTERIGNCDAHSSVSRSAHNRISQPTSTTVRKVKAVPTQIASGKKGKR